MNKVFNIAVLVINGKELACADTADARGLALVKSWAREPERLGFDSFSWMPSHCRPKVEFAMRMASRLPQYDGGFLPDQSAGH